MTIETVPDSSLRYFLINYDKHGRERLDDPHAPNGRLSDTVAETLAGEPITDVFFMSHGWQGDVPAAKRQYDAWSAAMAANAADIERLRARRADFRPLLIGIHWPSLPWGEEDPLAEHAAFAAGEGAPNLVDEAAEAIADTPTARAALEVIFRAASEDLTPESLPAEVVAAYQTLFDEAGLSADGPDGAPGNDLDGFDPEEVYQEEQQAGDAFGLGGAIIGGLLAPLRQLSFWRMKRRAALIGEGEAGGLLRRLMALAEGRGTRFHLMGHSFGCILVSAAVQGPRDGRPLPYPVSSLFLAQGALSLWAYASDNPRARGANPGYFHPLIQKGLVAGPVVTTRSARDTAVGVFYPIGSRLGGPEDFAPGQLPRYGAVGAFGIQGPGVDIVELVMPGEGADYGFEPGRIYNLEASAVINEGGGVVGAHNDIAKPAVAQAFWQAVTAAG